MIQIIEKNYKKTYRHCCTNCKCLFSYNLEDCRREFNSYDGSGYFFIKCPVCSQEDRVGALEKIDDEVIEPIFSKFIL